MNAAAAGSGPGSPAAAERPLPQWLPWAFLTLLVLPVHPMWVDFEQVRRGLLLMLAGGCLLFLPQLPRLRGERALLAFFGFLVVCALVNLIGQVFLRAADQPLSFQWWDAAYRLLHWLSLWVVLRLGAASTTNVVMPMSMLLLATSLFGLLQRLGLGEWHGYGVEREPVSMFGNLNVASEWTAVAAMVVAVLLPTVQDERRRAGMFATLGLASAYLVVDQSRSGLVALPVALLLLAVLRRRVVALLPLGAVVAGGVLGVVLSAASPLPQPSDTRAALAEQKRSTVTLAVRMEIAKGTTQLLAESPVFGFGPGQFAVQYPRVRTEAEIEASSHGRRFASEVRTAHDDWLELLVEGGLPALLLFSLVLFSLQRSQRDKSRLVPLFGLLLLMLVRSPLGNAPAVVAALWLVAVPARVPAGVPNAGGAGGWRRWLAIGTGLCMFGFGVLPVLGNTLFAPYQYARAFGESPPLSAVSNASWCMPFEPRWLSLLAQTHLIAADRSKSAGQQASFASHVDQATLYASRAIQLRPFDASLYQWLVEALAKAGRQPEAITLANHALKLDPANPELRVALSATLAQYGRTDAAIAAVVYEPHAQLRAGLARHFADLTQVAKSRGDTQGANRFAVEHHCVAAIDLLGDHEPAALLDAEQHITQMVQAMREASAPTDVRMLALSALHFLDLDQVDAAINLGKNAERANVPLQDWQRALFGAQLDRLRAFASWTKAIGSR